MDTLDFNLPDHLKEFVQTRLTEGGYDSVSEYIRDLINADQKKQARAVLEAELLKGIDSGPAVTMTADDWNSIRAEVRDRIDSRAKKVS